MPRDCVIAQFEGVHEVTMPSLITTLNRLGWTPTVVMNERCAERGDIFDHIGTAEFHLHYAPLNGRADWPDFLGKIGSVDPEFVLVNTFQFEGSLRTTLELGRPLIGLVHNASIFADREMAGAAQRRPDVALLTLWDHVSHALRSRLGVRGDNIHTYYLTHLMDSSEPRPVSTPTRSVAITGAVDVRNRGLAAFLSGLKSAMERSESADVRFIFCGAGPDRASFEDEVAAAGLGRWVDFLPRTGDDGFVHYDAYLSALTTSDLIGALLPVQRRDYLDHKVTSGALTALALGLPLWADWATLSTHQLPGVGYPSDDIPVGVQRLAALSDEALNELKDHSESVRQVRAKLSDRALAAAIEQVTGHGN